MSTLREFTTGFSLGQQLRRDKQQEAARAQASALAGGGDYVGAAFRDKGYKGVREAAGAEGDIGMAADMDNAISAMDDRTRAEAGLRAQFFAQTAYGLAQVPQDQRQAALMEIVEQSGEAFGITPEQAMGFDLSDGNLKLAYENSLSVADRINRTDRQAREKVEGERWGKTYDLEKRRTDLAERELEAKTEAAKGPDVSDEGGVRREYLGQAKSFVEVRDAFARITETENTPVGDVALVYSVIKLLDPGTGVKEGEIAMAGDTTGVPQQMLNLYNRIAKGDKLDAKQRADFKRQAGRLYSAAERDYGSLVDIYRDIVSDYPGMDPERVIPDLRVVDFGDLEDFGGGEGAGDDPARKQELDAILFGGF